MNAKSNSAKRHRGPKAEPPRERTIVDREPEKLAAPPDTAVEVKMTAAPDPDAPAPAAPAAAAAVAQAAISDPRIDCVLAHDIVSHTLRGGINYLYLGRVDAAPMGGNTLDLKIVLQLAMPLDGFLNSFFMLEATIKKMQMEGIVTKEMVNAGRSRYALKDDGGV